jgi:hypothetical protein
MCVSLSVLRVGGCHKISWQDAADKLATVRAGCVFYGEGHIWSKGKGSSRVCVCGGGGGAEAISWQDAADKLATVRAGVGMAMEGEGMCRCVFVLTQEVQPGDVQGSAAGSGSWVVQALSGVCTVQSFAQPSGCGRQACQAARVLLLLECLRLGVTQATECDTGKAMMLR